MPAIPTFDALREVAKAEIQLRRPDLTDFNEGSVLDAITGAAAVMADEVIRIGIEGFATLFFDTASGADLDALAQDRFGISRKPATAAVGTVTWTRHASGAYVILAGTRFRATVNNETVVYQSTQAVTLLASENTATIPVQAMTTGRGANAAAGVVDEIVDVHVSDPQATVTNPEPMAGGSDAETDEHFRSRIRRIYSTLRRGTKAALETGARSVPGVAVVTVDESEVEDTGWVRVFIGDPDARSNDTLAALVATELENWRACGVLVSVLGAEREEVPLELRIEVEPGADVTVVAAAVRAAIVAYGDGLNPGEPGRRSRIEKACHDASELVVAAEIDTLDADMVPSADENAIRFVTDQIQITFGAV